MLLNKIPVSLAFLSIWSSCIYDCCICNFYKYNKWNLQKQEMATYSFISQGGQLL